MLGGVKIEFAQALALGVEGARVRFAPKAGELACGTGPHQGHAQDPQGQHPRLCLRKMRPDTLKSSLSTGIIGLGEAGLVFFSSKGRGIFTLRENQSVSLKFAHKQKPVQRPTPIRRLGGGLSTVQFIPCAKHLSVEASCLTKCGGAMTLQ